MFALVVGLSSLVSFAFSLWALKSTKPVHFWSGTSVDPSQIDDFKQYNQKNALMWGCHGALMLCVAALGLVNIQVATAMLIVLAIPGSVVLMWIYTQIRKRHSVNENENIIVQVRNKTSRFTLFIGLSITIITVIISGILFYYGDKDPDIRIENNSVTILSLYQTRLDFDNIEGIEIIHQSMYELGLGTRISGYKGFTQAAKGRFRSPTYGDIVVYVQGNTKVTIRIHVSNQNDVFISLRSVDATKALYDKLIKQFKE